ncbi:lytic transglycosylase F [Bradyrhizobium liaoningense]|uniref:transglycosylase SLT domain-containing protein n=1 Tax=Bradyrhizobium liaoningense TaxID=43992 RepID=UPI001BA80F88|nr:lytic transglycosylase F [Bradyrhizobium liaoningense]MBR0819899.1 lytic transglycosylase F [Bradyrhizobium liaoningense]
MFAYSNDLNLPSLAARHLLALGVFLFANCSAEADPKVLALPALKAWQGDFDGMQKRRMVRILVPTDRTSFFIDKGEQLGFDAELGAEFENWLNRRYGNKKQRFYVGFVPTPRDRLLSDLIAGKGDIAAGLLTVTPERSKLVDFADPWASGVREVLVTGSAAPSVGSLNDLGGKMIQVRQSSSYFEHLAALNADRKAKGLEPVVVQPADKNLEDEDLLEMVSAGLLPWAVVDRFKAQAWAGLLNGLTVRDDIAINEGGDIAWAIRKDSPGLKKELAEFVSTHKIGTEFGNDLRARYFKTAKPLRNALAHNEAEKFKALRASFQKYGVQYSIDPVLLAAQGYQESELDQACHNASGATGIMQIKPSTAKEKPIGITGVAASADTNIHAGSKYLRYLADTYVDASVADPRERVFMALAAYNAGPGNLKRFRDYASKHGFDSTIWFGNVENGAAAIVGQETVQYDGKIYKHYISYETLRAPGPASATADPSQK